MWIQLVRIQHQMTTMINKKTKLEKLHQFKLENQGLIVQISGGNEDQAVETSKKDKDALETSKYDTYGHAYEGILTYPS